MSDSVRPHRRQPTKLPCPWDSPGKNTEVGCHFLLQCMKVKSESEVAQSCPTLATPWTATYQAPLSMGFSRQEYWSGVPLPSPNTDRYCQVYLPQTLRQFIFEPIVWGEPTFQHPNTGFLKGCVFVSQSNRKIQYLIVDF